MSVHNAVFADPSTDHVFPQHLLEPTYQNRLRVIGRYLDEGQFHSITLLEIPGGFVVRGSCNDDPWPALVEFGDRNLSDMLKRAFELRGVGMMPKEARDLVPTGYEDLFRAIGYELDQRIAENVVIAELPSLLAVSGFEPVLGFGESTYRPFSDPYAAEDVAQVLAQALGRRGTYRHVQTYIPPNFRG